MKSPLLGILGGLGPMSGVYFCKILTEHTDASSDGEHLNFLLSSRADTPDRTDFILGRSKLDPVPVMICEVNKLISAGADVIAIPCNTAHHFYERIKERTEVPIINIIQQTVDFCRFANIKKVGVLATEGTILSGAYETECRSAEIEYMTCTPEEQSVISSIIYDEIKKGLPPSLDRFLSVADALTACGCEAIILGCTELSLLKQDHKLDDRFIDSLEVLACSAIKTCKKNVRGFDERLLRFTPSNLKAKGTNICC